MEGCRRRRSTCAAVRVGRAESVEDPVSQSTRVRTATGHAARPADGRPPRATCAGWSTPSSSSCLRRRRRSTMQHERDRARGARCRPTPHDQAGGRAALLPGLAPSALRHRPSWSACGSSTCSARGRCPTSPVLGRGRRLLLRAAAAPDDGPLRPRIDRRWPRRPATSPTSPTWRAVANLAMLEADDHRLGRWSTWPRGGNHHGPATSWIRLIRECLRAPRPGGRARVRAAADRRHPPLPGGRRCRRRACWASARGSFPGPRPGAHGRVVSCPAFARSLRPPPCRRPSSRARSPVSQREAP